MVKQRRISPGSRVKRWIVSLCLMGAVLTGAGLAGLQQLAGERLVKGLAGAGAASIPCRTALYDRCLRPLAVSLPLTSVYAKPLEFRADVTAKNRLAELLGQKPAAIDRLLQSDKSTVWLGRYLPPAVLEAIGELGVKGLYFVREPQRFYPAGSSGAHVVGYYQSGHGLGGAEFYYDQLLNRIAGRNVKGTAGEKLVGADLVLTLDLVLQKQVEKELAAILAASGGRHGAAVVLNVADGSIMAMGLAPGYDPNRFWTTEVAVLDNALLRQRRIPRAYLQFLAYVAAVEATTAAGPSATAEGVELVTVGGQWTSVGDGQYGTALPFMAQHHALAEGQMGSLLDRLEIVGPSPVDLPTAGWANKGEPALQPTAIPLQLLVGLAAVLNSGQVVEPHVLAGGYRTATDEITWLPRPAAKKAFPAVEVNDALHDQLHTSIKRGFFLESVQTGGDEENWHAGMLFGVTPGRTPKVAVLIMVDDGNLPLQTASPMRPAARRILARAMACLAAEATVQVVSHQPDSQQMWYRQWREIRQEKRPQGALRVAEQQPAVMPELTGLSLRQALRSLAPLQLQVTFRGAGRVVGQQPAAGTVLKQHRRCALQLATKLSPS